MTGSELAPRTRDGAIRRFFGGMTYLGRGLGMWITSPRIMFLGALPAFIVGLLYTALLVVFALNLDALAALVTPFAERFDEPLRVATRFAAGAALVGAVVLLAIFTFVAVTLALGDPFYERIWRTVEERIGDAPSDGDEPFWRAAFRTLGTALRLLALTVAVGLALFACSFIPLVGQIAAPVLGAILGGWVLTLELTGFAFDARQIPLRQRRRMLGSRRANTLGFGVLTYLLFLVPFGAVLIMPAAVAGATMLSRDALAADALAARASATPASAAPGSAAPGSAPLGSAPRAERRRYATTRVEEEAPSPSVVRNSC